MDKPIERSISTFAVAISFLLLAIVEFTCSNKSIISTAVVPTPCEVVTVRDAVGSFILKDVNGSYPLLPTPSVVIRFTSTFNTRLSFHLNGQALEAVGSSETERIRRKLDNGEGFYWIENFGFAYFDYVDVRITLSPNHRRSLTPLDVTITKSYPPNSSYGEIAKRFANLTFIPKQPHIATPSDVFFDCSSDENVDEFQLNCRDSKSLIKKDVLVAGWLLGPPGINMGGKGLEDMLVEITPDIDFWEQMYGKSGHYPILDGVKLPGSRNRMRPPANDLNFLLNDKDPTGSDRGITINSFTLPNLEGKTEDAVNRGHLMKMHCEMNAWNVKDQQAPDPNYSPFRGRGAPPPTGWTSYSFPNNNPQIPLVYSANAFWPYNPTLDSRGNQLKEGDYVIFKGTLFQDHSHGDTEWLINCSEDHAGHLEIHPIDWIEKQPDKKTNRQVMSVSLIHRYPCEVADAVDLSDRSLNGSTEAWDNINDTKSGTFNVFPNIYLFDPFPKEDELGIEELIDGRFTERNSKSEIKYLGNFHWEIKVTVTRKTTFRRGKKIRRDGRFKASYIIYRKKKV